MRCLALFLVVAGPALAAPRVLLFPALGTPGQVTVSGRVLKDTPTGGSSTLSKNLRRLAASNLEGAKVEVRFQGLSATATSGHDGNFEVTFEAKKDAPFAAGFATAEGKVDASDVATATVTVVAPGAPFVVISDFDDTVAVTRVTSKRGLFKSALLQDSDTQPAVEGMPAFYGCLEAGKAARPGFALVSGSPAQYSGRVGAFLKQHAFPPFGLYLRDLGPKTLKDYKQPVIRALMNALPHKVVLVGDSGEHDPEVYAQIRAENPGRVAAVYIRDAGKTGDMARFKDMLLFKHPAEAARDAVKRGLAEAACVDKAFPPEPKK